MAILFMITDAQVEQFSESSNQPIYTLTCPSSESDPPDCTATLAPDSCDHSMNLGVRCLTCQEAIHDSSSSDTTVDNTQGEIVLALW